MLCEFLRQGRRSVHLVRNARFFTSSAPAQAEELKSAFAEALPRQQERLKALKKEYGSNEIHSVNVNMAIGGMRGITGLLYETSLLDADEGIRFRGYTIPELQVCLCLPLLVLFPLTILHMDLRACIVWFSRQFKPGRTATFTCRNCCRLRRVDRSHFQKAYYGCF